MRKRKSRSNDEIRQLPDWLRKAIGSGSADRPCKIGANISEDALRRLVAVKGYEDVDYGQIIEGLLLTYVLGYTISCRKPGEKTEAA